jgi:hypothetical protein
MRMIQFNPRMPWDDDAFRQRVTARAAFLGKTVSAVLREAGLSPSYLKSTRPRGRRLDTLAAVAHALEWTIDEVAGLAAPQVATAALNFSYLTAAVRVTSSIFGRALSAEEGARTARTIARVYDIFREAGAVPDETGLALVTAAIKTETTR